MHDEEKFGWPGRDAVVAAYVQHRQAMVRRYRSIVGNSADAEDAVSEAFLRALDERPSDIVNMRAWLFTVARGSTAPGRTWGSAARLPGHTSVGDGHGVIMARAFEVGVTIAVLAVTGVSAILRLSQTHMSVDAVGLLPTLRVVTLFK